MWRKAVSELEVLVKNESQRESNQETLIGQAQGKDETSAQVLQDHHISKHSVCLMNFKG